MLTWRSGPGGTAPDGPFKLGCKVQARKKFFDNALDMVEIIGFGLLLPVPGRRPRQSPATRLA